MSKSEQHPEPEAAADREYDADGPLNASTMSGDIRDVLLAHIRTLRAPWEAMSEEQQNNVINSCTAAGEHLVRRAVQLVSATQAPHVVVTLAEVGVKGADKALIMKMTASNIALYRQTLGDHVGAQCCLVMVDSERYMGERAAARSMPDQPDLDLDLDQ